MTDADQEIKHLIDQGSFSSAQQILTRKLAKYPNRSYYHALKNHLLFSQGKIPQAIEGNKSLLEKTPNDPDTLSLLNSFFNEVGLEQEANQVYENAIRKYPNNRIILDWYEIALKRFDLRLLQKASLQLQKNNKDNRKYVLWASFSYFLLSESNVTEKETQLFQSLGLKLIENLKPIQNDQELYILVNFLLKTKNQEQAQVEIERLMSSKNICLELKLIYSSILVDLSKWEKIIEYTKNLIFNENFNDFDTWKLLIKASKNTNIPLECIKSTISSFKFSRNTTLAFVELAVVYEEEILPSIANYLNKFLAKSCCFYDLKGYIKHVDRDEVLSILWDVKQKLDESNDTSLPTLIKIINIQKFEYFLRQDINIDDFTRDNWNYFHKFKHLLDSKDQYDIFPANELVLMNVILELEKDRNVFKSIITIEKILQNDKQDTKLRLWLLRLYSHLGFTNFSLHNYKELKIKMIQNDTLGHYLKLCPSNKALEDCIQIFRFYLTADSEISDSLLDGFDKMTFTKLESILNFGKKVTNSFSRFELIFNIIQCCKLCKNHQYLEYFHNLLQQFERQLLDDNLPIYDNRDIKTIWKFGINDKRELNLSSVTKKEEYIHLRLFKELILITKDSTKVSSLFKNFNKLLNKADVTTAQLGKFENWIYKIYLNIFKLVKLPPSKEDDSIINYLNKNLKFSKLKPLLIPSNVLSSELITNISLLLELLKDIQTLQIGSGSFGATLKTLSFTLTNELKQLPLKSLQLEELQKVRDTLVDNNLSDDKFINDSFESYKDAIVQNSGILKMA